MRMVGIGRNFIRDSIFWDSIDGTSGEDMIELTWGDDEARAGDGNDAIWDLDGENQNGYLGNPGDPIWLASSDRIYGGAGDDLVFAGLGADTVYGGTGWDRVDYRYSDSGIVLDLATGIGTGIGSGAGSSGSAGDRIFGVEEIGGSRFADTIKAGSGSQVLYGGNGDDSLRGGTGQTTLNGGAGNDTFVLNTITTAVMGGDGIDTISFYKLTTGVAFTPDFDLVPAALLAVTDDYYGLDTIETVIGTRQADAITLQSSGTQHTIWGQDGNDLLSVYGSGSVMYGGTGHDTLEGAIGDDTLYGDSGDDRISGHGGIDKAYGGDGNDALFGGFGNDALSGGAGNDRLDGGSGLDTLTGGSGADTFIFTGPDLYPVAGANLITDFVSGSDRIDLSALDANTSVAGNQTFAFIPFASKMVQAGTVRVSTVDGTTRLSVQTDGDGVADLIIDLHSPMALTAGDFIL